MGPGLVYPQGSCVSCLLSHFVRGKSFTSFSALLIINYLFILFLFIQQVVSGYIFFLIRHCMVSWPFLDEENRHTSFFFNTLVFLFFFNFILFLNFTILYWFCQTPKWILHRYTCVPHPEPSSLLPPHTIPLGRPSAPAPSIQYRA